MKTQEIVKIVNKKEMPELRKYFFSAKESNLEFSMLNLAIDRMEINSVEKNDSAIDLYRRIDEASDDQNLTSEENSILAIIKDKLSKKISDFENGHYKCSELSGVELLRFLISTNNVSQRELAKTVGSQGYVSDMLSGKRKISLTIARKLGEYFKVQPMLFLQ